MPDYETIREDRIATGATATISGVPVEGVERRIGDRNFVRIRTCVCVTAEGCPCNDPLIWLPEDDVVTSESSGDRSKDGENIHHDRLAPTSQVTVESYTSVPARNASRTIEGNKLANASVREFGTEMVGFSSGSRSTAQNRYGTKTNTTPPGTAALIGAGVGLGPAGAVTGVFMPGLTVGTYIDEKADASDVISDILIYLFG